jgi:hypothetical protein
MGEYLYKKERRTKLFSRSETMSIDLKAFIMISVGVFLGIMVGIIVLTKPTADFGTAVISTIFTWSILFVTVAFFVRIGRRYDSFSIHSKNVRSLNRENYAKLIEMAKGAELTGDFDKAIEIHQMLLQHKENSKPEKTAASIARIYDSIYRNEKQASYWYRKSIALACVDGACKSNPYAGYSYKRLGQMGKTPSSTYLSNQ